MPLLVRSLDELLSGLERAVRADPTDFSSFQALALRLFRLGQHERMKAIARDGALEHALAAVRAQAQLRSMRRLRQRTKGHVLLATRPGSDDTPRHVCSCSPSCCACCRLEQAPWHWLRSDELRAALGSEVVRAVQFHDAAVRPSPRVLAGLGAVESITGLFGVTNRELAALGELTELRTLYVEAGRATDDGLEALAHLDRLESLTVHEGQQFTGLGFESLLEKGPPLRSIRVFGGGSLVDDFLLLLGGLETVEEIVLWCGSHVTDAGLAYLGDRENLRRLDLDVPRLTDAGVANIRELTLERLSVRNGLIGDHGLRTIADMRSLVRLTVRALGATDAGVAALGSLRSLESLSLHVTSRVSQSALDDLRAALPATRHDLWVRCNDPDDFGEWGGFRRA